MIDAIAGCAPTDRVEEFARAALEITDGSLRAEALEPVLLALARTDRWRDAVAAACAVSNLAKALASIGSGLDEGSLLARTTLGGWSSTPSTSGTRRSLLRNRGISRNAGHARRRRCNPCGGRQSSEQATSGE